MSASEVEPGYGARRLGPEEELSSNKPESWTELDLIYIRSKSDKMIMGAPPALAHSAPCCKRVSMSSFPSGIFLLPLTTTALEYHYLAQQNFVQVYNMCIGAKFVGIFAGLQDD
ncbi:hypothetical protein FRACYDRAFT_249069 [Fragilariopsis cylindrus CCMP1102]|uniref:Uncharacterized protein n=1 Tax=Fragilariopsis cylindrus CCMP1102 TaxID=635003 RepID=A0A1E7ETE8_9STRA|nr:hypothetical protein FRACYDRAFT_249069 [Fragilariopsis cylindrus CCMP1102]|eukprot:OEU09152.1 hypothetical protein FRACYDRAFT_249069 [Fragilariopsis cylindrus CCMP1102]